MELPKTTKRILVVDDEYAIRVLLKNFLEGHTYEVRLAEDGKTAYEAFTEFKPGLVITDIMMPMENGLSIAARIRSLDPSVRVLYLSAWLDEAETEKKLNEELNSHPYCRLILKPFNLDALLQTIQELFALA
jgi:two-component system response regulator (stage 0 sporulation protein F)